MTCILATFVQIFGGMKQNNAEILKGPGLNETQVFSHSNISSSETFIFVEYKWIFAAFLLSGEPFIIEPSSTRLSSW